MLDHASVRYLAAVLSCILYGFIGYGIERHQTLPLFVCYFGLFLMYCLVISKKDRQEVVFWLVCSIVFRCVLFFSMPALSDDFYRFIWDGRVIAAGFNPYSEVPSFYMQGPPVPGLNTTLFELLNSRERYSSYPPLCQFVFWLSAALSPSSVWGSVVIMRAVLLVFELGTLWIIHKLIQHLKLPPNTILLYALCPLVIVEITGNLHFEGVMLFFLFLSVVLLLQNAFTLSILSLAMSVCTKLIPLIFLPLLLKYLGWKKAVVYWMGTGAITLTLFVPLLDAGIVHGFSTSLGYYFQTFEFNASIYYVIREAGYLIFGFNIIQFAGPVLGCAAFVVILYLSWRDSSPGERHITHEIFLTMLWCLFVYFLSTTILHPWYIITLLGISVLTPYRFPVIWTGLIFLTYSGYTPTGFQENYLLVTFEYVFLFLVIFYETAWKTKAKTSL